MKSKENQTHRSNQLSLTRINCARSKSDYKRELSSACAEIINRVFNNNRSQIVKNIELVKHILVVVVETIKLIDFATCSIELVDSLFQMVFNFILVKIEDHLNVDWCDLHGICEYLIAKLGETNKNILVRSFHYNCLLF